MANNRMWLLHKPTGLAVMLGKRMAIGWYTHNDPDMNKFFDAVGAADSEIQQDHFCLAMEDCREAPSCFNDWRYGPDPADGQVRKLEVLK